MRVSPLMMAVVATMNLNPLTLPRNLSAAISAKVTPPRKKTSTLRLEGGGGEGKRHLDHAEKIKQERR